MAKVKVKNAVSGIYGTLVSGNQKAIVAFVVVTVGTILVQNGLSLDMTVKEAVEAVANGVISSVAVWLKANRG